MGKPCYEAKKSPIPLGFVLQVARLRLRLKLERQQEVYRYTRENGEVTECMIVEERELTGCESHPFVGQGQNHL